VRRLLLGVIAAAIVLAASVPAHASEPAPTPCERSCGQDSTITSTGTHTPAQSCIHDAGCGGGGVLTTSATPWLVALAAGAGVVVCALAVRRVRTIRRTAPTSVLEASRLFRPPRLLLGI